MDKHYGMSKSKEWYTPKMYVESSRHVMGSIDTDPASCAFAQETVKATTWYGQKDNGLNKDWYGNVFLNPPYGRHPKGGYSQDVWTDKLMYEFELGNVEQAILLITNATDSRRFIGLFDFRVCMVRGRIDFYGPDGKPVKNNTKGSVFVHITNKPSPKFYWTFSQYGTIVERASP